MKKVSIVTISFNQAAFLERAILSVLNQDHPLIEYIIVDPGSTDGSREIIDKYRDRLACVVLESDAGPADGLNKGFLQASGDICGYLNADDEFLPGAVGKAVRAFDSNPKADAVYAHGYIVDANGQVERKFRSTRFDLKRYVHGGVVVMQQATFFRRDAWIDVGGFNRESPIAWDAELLIDFALNGKSMELIDDYWGLFRIHGESITNSLWEKDNSERAKSLAALLVKDRERIKLKVLGRPPRKIDVVLIVIARLQKWMLDPVGFGSRLMELAIGPNRQTHPMP